MEPERRHTHSTQTSRITKSDEFDPGKPDLGVQPQSFSNLPSVGRKSAQIRVAAALTAMIPLAGLGLARSLTPNSSGLGTHQQLGLPPCSMRLLFGIRCPGCGMTTSWAHFMQGNWSESIAASAGGFLFAIFAVWIAFLAIRTALNGRIPGNRTQQMIALSAAGIFAIALLQWVQRLLE